MHAGALPLDQPLEILERPRGLSFRMPSLVGSPFLHDAVEQPPRQTRLGPQVGESRPRFAACRSGLEKEGKSAASQAGKCVDRRAQVEGDLTPDRDQHEYLAGMRSTVIGFALALVVASSLHAQQWNDARAVSLARLAT